ncbi:MAG: hypothetical protein A2070_14520 [Bdellovibrionales bacterium GWC1_52_8]|nr:MAG: hypothetical protein A2Z97_01095 [Bdellovibrionales bacterium GWB1_52_6]OFZ34946.1 MAG: hypothetical protein A2070_14520 [Bdellovibrionales bacterium GWC1_52_8]HCM38918.1 hypothetical protein [Bdellovibrionales bacterium]
MPIGLTVRNALNSYTDRHTGRKDEDFRPPFPGSSFLRETKEKGAAPDDIAPGGTGFRLVPMAQPLRRCKFGFGKLVLSFHFFCENQLPKPADDVRWPSSRAVWI